MARRKKSFADVVEQMSRITRLKQVLGKRNTTEAVGGKQYQEYTNRHSQLNARYNRAVATTQKYINNIQNKTASPVQKVSYSARAGLNG